MKRREDTQSCRKVVISRKQCTELLGPQKFRDLRDR